MTVPGTIRIRRSIRGRDEDTYPEPSGATQGSEFEIDKLDVLKACDVDRKRKQSLHRVFLMSHRMTKYEHIATPFKDYPLVMRRSHSTRRTVQTQTRT